MMDIYDFKRLNVTYGHPLGDEVLRAVAKTIKQNLRTEDSVARYGGEEFVAILPETETQGAQTVAEKLRLRLQELRIVHGSESLGVTGLGHLPLPCITKQTLIQSADDALYASKRAGKNRVSVGGKVNRGANTLFGCPADPLRFHAPGLKARPSANTAWMVFRIPSWLGE